MQGRDHFAKCRELERQRTIGMEAEGGAIEHELILPAHLIDVNDGQVALGDARNHDVEPHLVLLAPIRRPVRHHHQLRPGLREAFHDLGGPDILADGNAQADAAKVDRARQRPRDEDAFLIKDAVVGQIDLEAERGDFTVGEQAVAVVELAGLDPWGADQHGRTAISRFTRKLLDVRPTARLQCRLEHEVFRRIAREKELRESNQISALPRGLCPRAPGLFGVSRNVSYDRIELCDCNRQRVRKDAGSCA